MADLLACDDRGLFCERGGFHIDPWKPVPLAVITHAHSDHARAGSGRYIASASSERVLRIRLGAEIELRALRFGEAVTLGAVRVSLHPAGHVLGSAQVRVETPDGEVWVAAGDYKRAADPTCEPFEVVPCDVFISEATFALPVYRWPSAESVAEQMLAWWDSNRASGRASIVLSYSLGKAQRLLAELMRAESRRGDGERPRLGGIERPIYLHGAVDGMVRAYREGGVELPETRAMSDPPLAIGARRAVKRSYSNALVVAPPSSTGTAWMKRFGSAGKYETAFASGWMQIRGVRRRGGHDRGFVLSDHADWDDLVRTCLETKAKRVLVTHGASATLARHLRELGVDAGVLRTDFGEAEE